MQKLPSNTGGNFHEFDRNLLNLTRYSILRIGKNFDTQIFWLKDLSFCMSVPSGTCIMVNTKWRNEATRTWRNEATVLSTKAHIQDVN